MNPGGPSEEAFKNLEWLLNCTARKESLSGEEISILSEVLLRWAGDRDLSDDTVRFCRIRVDRRSDACRE